MKIVQSSQITRCTLCTCSRATLNYKLYSGARVLQVVLRSPDPDLIQWRLNRAKQLRPLGHQTPQCCGATGTSSDIWSVLLCECANRCNVLKPTMADLINVRSRARPFDREPSFVCLHDGAGGSTQKIVKCFKIAERVRVNPTCPKSQLWPKIGCYP